MWLLGEHRSGDERVRGLLLHRSADTRRPRDRVRALRMLGHRWPDAEQAPRTVVRAAADPDPDIRMACLDAPGSHRPWREDVREVVLRLAADDPGNWVH